MKHFKKMVSKEIQEKILELTNIVKGEYISDVLHHAHKAHGRTDINEISGVSYDGFCAFQDGGFEVTEFYSSDGNEFTEKETEAREKFYNENYKTFLDDENLDKDLKIEKLTEKQLDDFQDFEIENSYPTLLRVEIWTDKEEVFIRLSSNYLDTPYYRSNYDETLKEKTLSHETFLKADNEVLAERLFEKINYKKKSL